MPIGLSHGAEEKRYKVAGRDAFRLEWPSGAFFGVERYDGYAAIQWSTNMGVAEGVAAIRTLIAEEGLAYTFEGGEHHELTVREALARVNRETEFARFETPFATFVLGAGELAVIAQPDRARLADLLTHTAVPVIATAAVDLAGRASGDT